MMKIIFMPTSWRKAEACDDAQKARIIADYLASMTDRYALLEYERILELGLYLSDMTISNTLQEDIIAICIEAFLGDVKQLGL